MPSQDRTGETPKQLAEAASPIPEPDTLDEDLQK